ncbi:DUF4374 domain-containing protein [Flammeovirgaceae bacterium SG7u.111]|nr:DUF4374 domain-containing protein [Flammeovirgaceae bacterium SG7u.132]WPO37200.1 DUF4374 domain-containing protein [Flammeovirgaceae bacterium SG7u.111]
MKTICNTTNFKKNMWALSLIFATSAFIFSCSDDSDDPEPNPEPIVSTRYFIAAENDNGTYFLAVDSLSGGTTTTAGNGIEDANSYTHYAYNGTSAVLALGYRQGDPATGRIFGLDTTGQLAEVGAGFQLTNSFSSIGPFENYLVTIKSGVTFADNTTGANFYFLDLDNDAAVSSKQLATMDLVKEGSDCSLVGVVDGGDGTFLTSVELDEGLDTCYVVKMDANLNVLNVMMDTRIGRALGQFRSARYSLIANDDEGNTYVFSNPIGGSKAGGALRINQGATSFDESYYFNIQEQANDYSFRKVFHVTENYFLLEFYNEYEPSSRTAATQYAIVNTEAKTFSWISGIPEFGNINDVGWPFSSDGKAYLPITTSDASPTVYVVDPVTATATAGVVVKAATGIGGLAKLTYTTESK